MKKLISLLLILALVLSLGACAKQEPAVNPEPDKPGKTDVKTPADYSDRKDKTGSLINREKQPHLTYPPKGN